MRATVLTTLSIAACAAEPAVPPVTAPNGMAYTLARQGAVDRQLPAGTTSVPIELAACPHERLFAGLPFGSAWILVNPDGDRCELWLGGETEDPSYGGAPTEYCRFARRGQVTIALGNGGPAALTSASCVPL